MLACLNETAITILGRRLAILPRYNVHRWRLNSFYYRYPETYTQCHGCYWLWSHGFQYDNFDTAVHCVWPAQPVASARWSVVTAQYEIINRRACLEWRQNSTWGAPHQPPRAVAHWHMRVYNADEHNHSGAARENTAPLMVITIYTNIPLDCNHTHSMNLKLFSNQQTYHTIRSDNNVT